MKKLESKVQELEISSRLALASDVKWDGSNSFDVPMFEMPKDFQIGVITGPSGSGKSSLLREFNRIEKSVEWDPTKAVVDHFDDFETSMDRFGASALNSVPDLLKPYHTLSTGQKARADLARLLEDNATIDEFSSTVDRNVAKAMATAIGKYIRRNNIKNVLIVSCHNDFLEYLKPDWTYDTGSKKLLTGRLAYPSEPNLQLQARKSSKDAWQLFKDHHYLDAKLPPSVVDCYTYYWEDKLVGFVAINVFPHGTLKGCMNISRMVVLPEYQGLGFGSKILDHICRTVTHNYFHSQATYGRIKIVTALPNLTNKFMKSKDWEHIKGSDKRPQISEGTKSNTGFKFAYFEKMAHRVTKSFHYVGPKGFDNDEIENRMINETIWSRADGKSVHKVTGFVRPDIRPGITGETKYQLLAEPGKPIIKRTGFENHSFKIKGADVVFPIMSGMKPEAIKGVELWMLDNWDQWKWDGDTPAVKAAKKIRSEWSDKTTKDEQLSLF